MDRKIVLQDLADALVRRRGVEKTEADAFVRSVFDVIAEYLQADRIVKIKGLGTFKLVTVDSRESVDVNTGERIVIKEYTKVNFTPDPVMRDAVNKPFAQFETVVLYEGTDVAEMERMDLPDEAFPVSVDDETEAQENESALPEDPSTDNLSAGEPEEASVGIGEDEPAMEASDTESVAAEDEESVEEEPEKDGADEIPICGNPAESVDELESLGADAERVDAEEETPSEEQQPEGGLAEEAKAEPRQEESVMDADTGQERAAETGQSPVLEPEKAAGGEGQPVSGAPHPQVVHVASQQIEVQKVEHQNVEHQHIVHVTPDHGKRRIYLTPWMIFFISIVLLLLMLFSYYLGYNRMFCEKEVGAVQIVSPAPQPVAPQVQPAKPVVQDTASFSRDTVCVTPIADSVQAEQPIAPSPKPETKKPQSATAYPQVKGGAYEIVGTRETHRMKSGETLHGIARHYYGSRNFTVYIVAYNKIANPDLVPEGMLLKIPELKLKRR